MIITVRIVEAMGFQQVALQLANNKKAEVRIMWGAFEIIIIGTLATFVVTQLILPPIFGYPVCWLFKRSHKQVAEKENELAELAVQEEIVDLNKEISSKKERLGKKILEKGGVVEGESPQTEEKKK